MRCYLIGLPLCFLFLAPFNPDVLPSVQVSERPGPPVADDQKPLPSDDQMQQLAREDPIAFLENCLRRYQREVKGYTAILEKQERLNGELKKKEVVEVCFREEPHSVCMHWLEGARRAQSALYVEGEHNGMMLARPTGRLIGRLIVERDPEGDEARDSGRYTIKEFGLRKGTERVLKAWRTTRDNGGLFVEFLGEEKLKEAGGRACYVLRRSRYAKPEADGIAETTIWVDKETWLQVGTMLQNKEGGLIATYYFRNLKLNPVFKPDQFKREALQR